MTVEHIRDYLAQYARQNDEGYTDDAGCWHEYAEGLIQDGILGMCCCGRPEDNLEYIRAGLELIAEESPDAMKNREAWNVWYTDHERRSMEHHKSWGARYFFWYWLDSQRLTEHGGSVPGWLTEKGRALLSLLREWNASEEETT